MKSKSLKSLSRFNFRSSIIATVFLTQMLAPYSSALAQTDDDGSDDQSQSQPQQPAPAPTPAPAPAPAPPPPVVYDDATATSAGAAEGARVANSVLSVEGVIQNVRYNIAIGFNQNLASFINSGSNGYNGYQYPVQSQSNDPNYRLGLNQGQSAGSADGAKDGASKAMTDASNSAGPQLTSYAQQVTNSHGAMQYQPPAPNTNPPAESFSQPPNAPAAPKMSDIMNATSSALNQAATPNVPSYAMPQAPANLNFAALTQSFVDSMKSKATELILMNGTKLQTAYLAKIDLNTYLSPSDILQNLRQNGLNSFLLNGDSGLQGAQVWAKYKKSVLSNYNNQTTLPGISTAEKTALIELEKGTNDEYGNVTSWKYQNHDQVEQEYAAAFINAYNQVIASKWRALVTQDLTSSYQAGGYGNGSGTYNPYAGGLNTIGAQANDYMVKIGMEYLIRQGIHDGYMSSYQQAGSGAFNNNYAPDFMNIWQNLSQQIATTPNINNLQFTDLNATAPHTLGDVLQIGFTGQNSGGKDGSLTVTVVPPSDISSMYAISGNQSTVNNIGRFSQVQTPQNLNLGLVVNNLPGNPDGTVTIPVQMSGYGIPNNSSANVTFNLNFEAMVYKLATTSDKGLQQSMTQFLAMYLKNEWNNNGSNIVDYYKSASNTTTIHRMVVQIQQLSPAQQAAFAQVAGQAVKSAYPSTQPSAGWFHAFSGRYSSWARIQSDLALIGIRM